MFFVAMFVFCFKEKNIRVNILHFYLINMNMHKDNEETCISVKSKCYFCCVLLMIPVAYKQC